METTILIIIYGLIIGVFLFELWLSNLNYKNRNSEIPEEVKDIYDEEVYSNWLKYTMENFRFSMIANIFNTLLFIFLLALQVFPALEEVAIEITGDIELQVVVFLGLYYLITFVFGIFFSYYRTFSIEERFGFNKSTKKTFVLDKIKGLILTFIFGGGLVYGIAQLSAIDSIMFYVYVWIGLVVIIFAVLILYVPVIIPIFNKLKPLDDGELKDMIHEFAKKVGYEVKKISVIDASKRSTKLNAFFSGFGKLKQIVLYDTLIEKMSNEQIVAVLAHEIGHNKYKHMIFNLGQSVITFAIYIGALALVIEVPEFSTAFGFDSSNLGFSLILFSVILSPISILINFITAYYSRKHEYQADNYAATNYSSEAIIEALKVLSRENYSNLTPHPLYVKLTYSHPPTVSRIRNIRKADVK